jgi:hypothetical protein
MSASRFNLPITKSWCVCVYLCACVYVCVRVCVCVCLRDPCLWVNGLQLHLSEESKSAHNTDIHYLCNQGYLSPLDLTIEVIWTKHRIWSYSNSYEICQKIWDWFISNYSITNDHIQQILHQYLVKILPHPYNIVIFHIACIKVLTLIWIWKPM